MKFQDLFSIALSAVLVGQLHAADPVVSNLAAAQRPGTRLVDIAYDVTADTPTVTVALEVSVDGGSTWAVPVTATSGDIGTDVTVGMSKTIVWDAGLDWHNQYSTQIRYRVTADDGVPTGPPEGFSLIPAGSFVMGRTSGDTDSDAPPVTVNVSAFYMAKNEVTKALWDQVRTWGLANGYTDLPAGGGKAANHPVHSINWYAMVKWCNARSQKEGLTPVYGVGGSVMKTGITVPSANWTANGYRPPTEAEWEKAARGGVSGKRFPWGADTITHSQANYNSNTLYSYDTSFTRSYHPTYNDGTTPYTSPVGSFGANGYGLLDMAGNVWEWCWDWYSGSTYTEGATDPRGVASGTLRVSRGGSWIFLAKECRAADRDSTNPGQPTNGTGFRPARSSVPDGSPTGTGSAVTTDGVLDTRQWTLSSPAASGGSIQGAGTYLNGTTATLIAVPDHGYLFSGWTGDASGITNPLSILMDSGKSIGATFRPDIGDDDADGLSNSREANEFGTNPADPDTDNDRVPDGLEVKELTDPNDPDDFSPFSKGMLAYYPFNGNAGDETGGGAPGTANGAVLMIDRYGGENSAYHFNGTDACIRVPATLEVASGDFAVGMWIKCENPETGWSSLMSRDGWADGWLAYQMDGDSSLTLGVGGEGFNTRVNLDIAAPWVAEAWNQVVYWRNGPGLKYIVYINGIHVADIPIPVAYSPLKIAPMEIGAWIGNLGAVRHRFFTGALDDIRIYHRPLSGAEAIALYRSERPMTLAYSTIAHGSVVGAGKYLTDTTATLIATPAPGYLFSGWTGDASGTASPLDILMDGDKTVGASFEPDLSDTDGNNLSAYLELAVYGTDPTKADTDGDGLSDAWEVGRGRFSIISGAFTWAQARADAQAKGGDLACFPDEHRWNHALETLGANALDDYTGLWLGASDAAEDGAWVWVNGETFSFQQWSTGRPSSTAGNTLDYLEVSGGAGGEIGKWYDRSPATVRDGYILESGYATDPTESDADHDGLNDSQEQAAGTSPFLADTDDDGLTDAQEVNLTHTNPKLADSDGDGTNDAADDEDGDTLSNLAEVTQHGTDPLKADTDDDGLSDSAELSHPASYFALVSGSFTHAQAEADAAGRRGRIASFPDASDFTRMAGKARRTTQGYLWIGLSDSAAEGTWLWTDGSAATYQRWLNGQPDGNTAENQAVIMENSTQWADAVADFEAAGYLFERIGLDPLSEDTDGDGLTDGREVNTIHSNPVLDDTDGDGLLDGAEVDTHGASPLLTDTDGDTLSDRVEVEIYHSNPSLKDTDGDGFDDAFEVNTGFDPTRDTSTPDALSSIRTAVEFRFNAADGVNYRIEDSTDLENWNIVETNIIGTGGVVTRFYTIENMPKRYFRARRN